MKGTSFVPYARTHCDCNGQVYHVSKRLKIARAMTKRERYLRIRTQLKDTMNPALEIEYFKY